MKPILIYSPVKHRYALAAQKIPFPSAAVLDVGGYKSREKHLTPFFQELSYTSVNIGPAWYKNDEPHFIYDGTTLPFGDKAFPYVICVDSLEHVMVEKRAKLVDEIVRVAQERAVIVVPFNNGEILDEEYLLRYSKRFGIDLMPSLVEHMKYGIPTMKELINYVEKYNHKITFASPRHLYWSFQLSMLLNQVVFGSEAEEINRSIYEFMENTLKSETDSLRQSEAYRAIITIDK